VTIPFYQPLGACEVLPRYAYLETLLPGRRILEVGAVAATSGRSAAFLRARGARRVLAIDSDPAAVDAARREHSADPDLRFFAGRLEDLSEAPFDLALVADAAPLIRLPSSLDLLARLLSPDGHVFLALRNPAGVSLARLIAEEPREAPPTWGELIATLEARFASVEAATQTALAGYRLTPTGAGDIDAAVDGTLAGAEECAYFLAMAGARRAGAFGDEAFVTLPVAPLLVSTDRRGELAERLRLAEEELALAGQNAPATSQDDLAGRVRALEAELSAAHARARRLERDVETLTALERTARQRAEQTELELAQKSPAKADASN
jgi:SAM-dependent methyltransferase